MACHSYPKLLAIVMTLTKPFSAADAFLSLETVPERQGDLGVLADASISCFRHAGFHRLPVWKAFQKGPSILLSTTC